MHVPPQREKTAREKGTMKPASSTELVSMINKKQLMMVMDSER
jgi:hypothetical protein